MVILDTSIIIDHLRQRQRHSQLLKLDQEYTKESLSISVITIQELYEGQSTRDDMLEQSLLATISPLKILSYTFELAKLAGEIARDLSRPIEFSDAAIAATAIAYGCQLATLNKKDFVGIAGLELV